MLQALAIGAFTILSDAMTEVITRENLAALLQADTHLSRALISLPPLLDRTEEIYRDRNWRLIKAFRQDWRERGIVFNGHKIQTRTQDDAPILAESLERLLGYRKLGAWLTEDNEAISFSNQDFLDMAGAIAHYAEQCLTSAQQFRCLLAEMSFDDLRLVPAEHEEVRTWIESGTKIRWPSNVYDEPPRNMVLADGAISTLVKRLEVQEQLISTLESELRGPEPQPFPGGIEPKVTGSKRSPNYWVYIRLNNETEADYAITGCKIVMRLDRPPISVSGGTFDRRDDGNYAISASNPLIREGKSLRISLKFNGTKAVAAEALGVVKR